MAVPVFEPGAAGWEARMLPLCYAAPQILFLMPPFWIWGKTGLNVFPTL